jgi:hypothetical protein
MFPFSLAGEKAPNGLDRKGPQSLKMLAFGRIGRAAVAGHFKERARAAIAAMVNFSLAGVFLPAKQLTWLANCDRSA